MADKKISALPAATTPLAGTEVLPIVQGGTTDKVSIANLTAGRTVATGQLNATGNLLVDYGGTERFIGSIYEPSPVYRNGVYLNAGTHVTEIATGSGDGAGYISFSTGGRTERARITYDGNFVISTAGKGIDFSANTHAAGMTSELLNDYEEGTFTPSFTSTGATITHAVRSGIYTKVGRLVTASVYLQVTSATGTLTNPLFISNLPYASVSTGEYGFSAAIGVHQFSGITPSMFMGLNSTNISVYVNGTVTSATPAALAAGYYLATITYMTS